MTKKQFERLSKYDEQLTTAKIGNYVRKMYSQSLIELDNIYRELFPTAAESNLKSGCSSCVVKAMKKIAEPYFKYKEKLEEKNKENDEKKQ